MREAKARGVPPATAERLGLHAECTRIDRRVGPRLRYGPELPLDEPTARRIFAAIQTATPAAHDMPPAEIARFDSDYLFSRRPNQAPDPRRDAAPATLVAQLVALAPAPGTPAPD